MLRRSTRAYETRARRCRPAPSANHSPALLWRCRPQSHTAPIRAIRPGCYRPDAQLRPVTSLQKGHSPEAATNVAACRAAGVDHTLSGGYGDDVDAVDRLEAVAHSVGVGGHPDGGRRLAVECDDERARHEADVASMIQRDFLDLDVVVSAERQDGNLQRGSAGNVIRIDATRIVRAVAVAEVPLGGGAAAATRSCGVSGSCH